MTGVEGVAIALTTLGEARETALAPDGIYPVVAPGEHLVGVALMPDVEDDAVRGTVENTVERHGELDHAEVRRQMTAVDRDDVDQLTAYLFAELSELLFIERLDVAGGFDFF